MAQRLLHFRGTLSAVLVTVLLAAAFSGAMASARLAPQGLHAHYPIERASTGSAGDVRAVASTRPVSLVGMGGTSASAGMLFAAVYSALTVLLMPRGWSKLASGLVPLPLRI